MDPKGDGSSYIYSQQDDYAFHSSTTGALSSFHGSGVANGYLPDPSLDPFVLTGASTAGGDGFEYRVDLQGLGFGYDCSLFGIATYHHWFAFTGDDYGWPSNQWFDQPRTWVLAKVETPRCTDLPAGKIAYVYRGNAEDASDYNLLVDAQYTVSLVPLSSILTTDFSFFDLILIADDTGSLDQWGSNGFTDAQVAQMTSPQSAHHRLG